MKKFLFLLLAAFISTNLQAKKFKGAEVRTNESFLYGRFEVKMKSSQASGMLISFFTFYDAPDFAQNWNEIDIEILGRYTNEVQYNAIVGAHKMNEHRQVLDFNPHEAFHVYSFDWTPEYIAWSVDGKELYRQTGEHIAEMNKPQKIMMNIWSSSYWAWTGAWEDPKLPLYASYDYVKYSKYDVAKKTFTLSWTDDFDKFNSGRWSAASHTFDGNTAEFSPENVEVKGGFLYLMLSKNEPVNNETAEPMNSSSPAHKEIISGIIESSALVRLTFAQDIYRPTAAKANYKIEGAEIIKTKLHADLRTLDLTVTGLEAGKEYVLKFSETTGEPQEVVLKWK
ncbi:MAG: family 16 glycosylhydrolase [Cytophagaceae bacterium]